MKSLWMISTLFSGPNFCMRNTVLAADATQGVAG